MFRKTINETPFTSQAANCCFSNISGTAWNHDVSFVSTLRALLADRIPAEEQVKLVITSRSLRASQARRGASSILESFIIPNPGDIHVSHFSSTTEDNETWMSLIENHFIDAFGQSWRRISRVTDFFRKTFKVVCFVNDADKSVCLFTDGMDTRRLHYLQCAVFAFLPWYFDPEKGVSELEMELIQSLRENSADKYENCLEKMILKYDLREAEIRRLLSGFETRLEKSRIDSLTNQVNGIINDTAFIMQGYYTNAVLANDAIAANADAIALNSAAISRLENTVSDIEKDLSAGIASVAALSSVAVSDVARGEVSVGGGYGYHNGESAAAFGFAIGLTDNWSMNAGAGISSADTTFRAGTNYKFKLF